MLHYAVMLHYGIAWNRVCVWFALMSTVRQWKLGLVERCNIITWPKTVWIIHPDIQQDLVVQGYSTIE